MKVSVQTRLAALGMAFALSAALAGCGATASTATAESAAESTAESTASSAAATGEDAYADIASFSSSDYFDDNGYFKGVTATDYVTLPADYTALSLPAGTDTITDDEVSSYISENILANYKTTDKITDRAAASGDKVNIDYVGTIGGVAFDGGNTNGGGADLTLGSGTYVPGFEDQIVGHTPGETFDVKVTFPTDYGSADLAGKDAVFSTTLNYISQDVTPELTDDWVAANLTDGYSVSTVGDLQALVRKNLTRSKVTGAVMDALTGTATFTALPQALTDYVSRYYAYRLYQVAAQYGVDVNTLLSAQGYDSVDAFLATQQSNLDSAVKQILVTQAAAEKQKIVCDDKALADNFFEYYGTAETAQYTDAYGTNYVKMMTLSNLVVDNLYATAKVAAA